MDELIILRLKFHALYVSTFFLNIVGMDKTQNTLILIEQLQVAE